MQLRLVRIFAGLCATVVSFITLAQAEEIFKGAAALVRGDYDEAIRYYSEELARPQLRPTVAGIQRANLVKALAGKGDLDGAYRETATFIRDNPTSPLGFDQRGHLNFLMGRYVDAADDFARALDLAVPDRNVFAIDPPITTIWLHLARHRAGQDDAVEFAQNTAKIDSRIWLSKYLGMFLGRLTYEEVAQFDPGTTIARRYHACFAPFFAGEHALITRQSDEAEDLLRRAQAKCTPDLWEYSALKVELARATR